MNCSEISILTPLFLSGELDPGRTGAVVEHLNVCETCGREVREQRALDQRLQRTIGDEPIDTSRIEQRIKASIAAGSRRRVVATLGIAAVLAMSVIGYQALVRSQTNAIYRAAADDHRREIVEHQPRPWQTDAASIARLAQRVGMSASTLEGISPAGYRLAQGRLCLLNGRLYLHLVYTDAHSNTSIFLRSVGTPSFRSGDAESFGHEHVSGVRKDQLIALVVSDESDAAAARLAQSLL